MSTSCSSSSVNSSMNNKNENSLSDKEININKYRIISQNSCEMPDEVLEIQQIEYEQHLILEEINRVDVEKQRLQDLLNLLQSMKSNDRKKSTKYRHHQLQRRDSNSGSE